MELEVADRELGVVDEGMERVELGLVHAVVERDLRVETLERVEEALLVRLVQRFTEVEVARAFCEDGASTTQPGRHDGDPYVPSNTHGDQRLSTRIRASAEAWPASSISTSAGSAPFSKAKVRLSL